MEKIPTLRNEVKVRKQKEYISSLYWCQKLSWTQMAASDTVTRVSEKTTREKPPTCNSIYLHTIYVYMLFSFSFLYENTESVWINVWRSKSEERRGAKKRSVEVWGKGYSIFTRFRSTDDTRKKEMKNTYNIQSTYKILLFLSSSLSLSLSLSLSHFSSIFLYPILFLSTVSVGVNCWTGA